MVVSVQNVSPLITIPAPHRSAACRRRQRGAGPGADIVTTRRARADAITLFDFRGAVRRGRCAVTTGRFSIRAVYPPRDNSRNSTWVTAAVRRPGMAT